MVGLLLAFALALRLGLSLSLVLACLVARDPQMSPGGSRLKRGIGKSESLPAVCSPVLSGKGMCALCSLAISGERPIERCST